MQLFTALKFSLMLPKKGAIFSLNRISMRNTLVYLFLLLFIALLPNVFISVSTQGEVINGGSRELFILQLVVFYPSLCIFLGITGISILAAGCIVIKALTKRKLAYQQLWKMTVFASTWPLFLYFLITISNIGHWLITLSLMIILYLLLFMMIKVYPKRTKK